MRQRRTQTHEQPDPHGDAPRWMIRAVWAAGLCTISLGALALSSPAQLAEWLAMGPAVDPMLWRYLGIVVASCGIAYVLSASRPLLYWPVIFAGLLQHLFAPFVLIHAFRAGPPPFRMVAFLFAADIVWWIPFCLILYRAYQAHLETCRSASPEVQELALKAKTTAGESLLELAERQPLLLFFLRHTGCPFCRESLARLANMRKQIEETGTRLVLIHMSSDSRAHRFLSRFGLADLPAISDPRRSLYRAFGLRRGTPWQVAGPHLWARGFPLLARRGQGISRKGGDLFQLSGLFLVFHGHVIRTFLHQSAGDIPDFLSFARGDLTQNEAFS